MKLITFGLPFGRSRLVRSANLPGIVIRASGCAAVGLFCLLSAFRAWSADCVSPPVGLVAWWPGEGNANDIAGTNNGVLEGGVAFGAGEVGHAFSFDGVSGLITNVMPGLTYIRSNYTMEFWAWPTAARASTGEATSGITGNSNQRYAIFPNNSGYSGFAGAGVSVGTNGVSVFEHAPYYLPSLLVYDAPVLGWTHIAVVYSNQQPRLYLNGALVRTGLTSGWVSYPSTCLGEMGAGFGYYAGLLDEVSIYNRVLSASEIQALYNAGSDGKCPELLILSQSRDQTVVVGSNVTFVVTASTAGGSLPFSYRWQFNGTNIAGATDSSYTRSNAQVAGAGTYIVAVTDALGRVASADMLLQVLPFGAPSIQINGRLAAGSVGADGSAQLTISGGFTNGLMFYTLDGTTPTTSSPFYTGPVTLTQSATVQAMSMSADFMQTAFAPAVWVQIFNLQTSVVGSGTISVNWHNPPYGSNTSVVVTAHAAANWGFGHWTGDVMGSQNPVSLTMNGPHSVQAVFVQTAYPLTAATPGGGTVSVNGQVIPPALFYYPIGSVVTLSATASNGWSFMGWQGDAGGTNNPLSLTMSQTNNLQGIFGTVVGTNTAGGGGIVLSQPNPIPYGTVLTASAVPDAGKYFVTWSGAASGTNTPTTISVTSANPSVSALFTTLPGRKNTLSLVVIGNGSVAISPQQNYYNPGDSVTLSASTTNAGTSFYGWTGDASGANNPASSGMFRQFFIERDKGPIHPDGRRCPT